MKTKLLLVCFLLSFTVFSQVGIGTTTPNGALDITSTTDGFLIPRIALTATNSALPLTSPTVSEMVYNTATAGTSPNDVVPGYYYWNGTSWQKLVSNLNIYNTDGTLTANRTVSQGSNNLTFSGTGNTIINSGQTGIGTSTPVGKLNVTGGLVLGTGFTGSAIGIPFAFGNTTSPALWFNPYTNLGSSDYGVAYFESTADVGTLKILSGDNSTGGGADDSVFIGNVEFTTGVQKGMTVKNGKVGIDETTPVYKLQVKGDIASTDGLIAKSVYNTSMSTTSVFTDNIEPWTDNGIKLYDGNTNSHLHLEAVGPSVIQSYGTSGSAKGFLEAPGTTSNLILQNSGSNVGIGTGGPTEKLDVFGNVKFSGALMPNNLAGASGEILTSSGSGVAPIWNTTATLLSNEWHIYGNSGTTAGTNFVGTNDAKDLVFKTTGSERYRVLANGYIGIGITTPTTQLQLGTDNGSSGGAIQVNLNDTDTQVQGIKTSVKRTTGNNYGVNGTAWGVGATANFGLYGWATGATSNWGLYVDQGNGYIQGNTGIGTTTPTKKLEVNGTIKATDINFTGLLIYANEAAAVAGGVLVSGDMYKTATGELRIKL